MPTVPGRGQRGDPASPRVAALSPDNAELRFCAHHQCAREPVSRGVCHAHYYQLTGRTQSRRLRPVRQPALSTDELVDEVLWLIGTDDPAAIARRLGFDHPTSLSRRLRRTGRSDLARHFETTHRSVA